MNDRAATVVASVAANLPGIGLPDVLATSELLDRAERKYLLRPTEFLLVVDALRGRLRALDIDGLRTFGYRSTYFDTPDLAVFRAHRQGRRRRFKIRTRTYTDTADTYCELKLAGRRDQTVKHRCRHVGADTLTGPALRFLDTQLGAAGLRLPTPLTPVLTTAYRRMTLVVDDGTARVTCDTGLVWSARGRTRAAGRGLVLVEVKAAHARNPVTEALSANGFRETPVSKFCTGVTALGLSAGGNRWLPVLRGLG